jgi:hypothetical protein
MSLLKLWNIHNHVLYSYTTCVCQRSSELCGYLGMLVCMRICTSAQPGLREFNTTYFVQWNFSFLFTVSLFGRKREMKTKIEQPYKTGGTSKKCTIALGGSHKEKECKDDKKGMTSNTSKHEEAMRRVQELFIFQPHKHVRFSFWLVGVCNDIGQTPIQDIEPILPLIDDIKQNNINKDQRPFYTEFDQINQYEGVMINILPLLIQATLPSLWMSILNLDCDVIQDDDTYFTWLADHILRQGHTYVTLTE